MWGHGQSQNADAEVQNIARILIFAFDLTEASQIRRIQSFRKLDHSVSSASFRRANMKSSQTPDWDNIDLGPVAYQSFGKRILKIAGAITRVLRTPAPLKSADVIVARNFDLLVVAWAAGLLTGQGKTPLVYECLDIHGLFTRQDAVGRVMRWCERRLLGRIDLLIVSSPGFIRSYFQPVQGYNGPYSLIENKLWFEQEALPRPDAPPKRSAKAPIHLGWVGSIRCKESLKILTQTADALGDKICVRIHGNIHRHVLPDFDAEIAARDNIDYLGPYDYPNDLARVYADCDVVWAQDLWQRGANSDWLLPNRIYEASWFGCPSIAVGDTETGRRVRDDDLGIVLEEASATALTESLAKVKRTELATMSRGILAQSDDKFRLRPDDIATALSPVLDQTAQEKPAQV